MGRKSSPSKKRSATSSRRKQPESPVYFVDRSLQCSTLIDTLKKAGAEIETHRDHFADDATDQEWLAEVGKKGWVVLHKDKRIRYRPIEKQALISAGVRAFVLTSGNMTGQEMADVFVKHFKKMEEMINTQRAPFIAAVTRSSVRVLFPTRGEEVW